MNFTIDQDRLTGTEDDFSVNLTIVSVTEDNRNMDIDFANNVLPINFEIEAQADIVINSLWVWNNPFSMAPPPPQFLQCPDFFDVVID